MKSILLLVLAILVVIPTIPISGQSSFTLDPKKSAFISSSQTECIYEYKVVSQKRETTDNIHETGTITDTYTTILQANATMSKFWDWNMYIKDSIQYSSTKQLSQDS